MASLSDQLRAALDALDAIDRQRAELDAQRRAAVESIDRQIAEVDARRLATQQTAQQLSAQLFASTPANAVVLPTVETAGSARDAGRINKHRRLREAQRQHPPVAPEGSWTAQALDLLRRHPDGLSSAALRLLFPDEPKRVQALYSAAHQLWSQDIVERQQAPGGYVYRIRPSAPESATPDFPYPHPAGTVTPADLPASLRGGRRM